MGGKSSSTRLKSCLEKGREAPKRQRPGTKRDYTCSGCGEQSCRANKKTCTKGRTATELMAQRRADITAREQKESDNEAKKAAKAKKKEEVILFIRTIILLNLSYYV